MATGRLPCDPDEGAETAAPCLRRDQVMSNPGSFRDRTNWLNGFCEPAIEVGSADVAGARAGLSAVWAAAGVQGSFAFTDREAGDRLR
ncbi:hypothetical protein GCM10019016_103350 [Streptomyces prasinosporus]|uniref:Uncharacterized protein n=1 Tax=Streptomyces prasinosporus TaxID=68256 RepID=A0ABP6U8I0_9ACTN